MKKEKKILLFFSFKRKRTAFVWREAHKGAVAPIVIMGQKDSKDLGSNRLTWGLVMAGDELEEVKARLAVGLPAVHIGEGVSCPDVPEKCRVLPGEA